MAPLSMGFSRQDYWSERPCPPLGDLPELGIKLTSLMSPTLAGRQAGRFFTTRATWEAPSVDVMWPKPHNLQPFIYIF